MKNGRIISVRLNEEDLNALSQASKAEGVKRSTLIQKAVKTYILNYGKKQPEVGELYSRVDDLERKVGNVLTRVNILTNQIDYIIKRQR